MYEKWIVERWETPVSDATGLSLMLLADWQGRLTLVVDGVSPAEPWIAFIFTNYVAYRNIVEEYRLALWRRLDQGTMRCGSTMIVQQAPQGDTFGDEPLVAVHNPGLQHYLLCTVDDVIEVWANTPPSMVVIDGADADAAPTRAARLEQILRQGC